ncbi:NAD(P)/FAD-dependent oxidoreductase [Rhizobium jaguaris]|uniref:Ferredoxin reductase n=1 Tax=Rhizobium jaguaris TaxID=1312183 RepID=A0A387FGR5_9HYPH|nr:FAD-dependent oxidoreductase [Rhizobium jaguaris]AYG57553.1 ferredoxin reductase [Rhizobium jaguaris]
MVILGAGECGARTAFALRENNYDGPITLVGDETHLPYERPPLSKSTLIDEPGHKPIAAMEQYRQASIEVRLGVKVVSILPAERSIAFSDGGRLPYDKLLLATGARPRRLPETTPSHGRIKYLRTFEDAVDIRSRLGTGKSLAIIGAGFIGLELAATARKMGTNVVVVEAQPRVLMRGVPEAIANVIATRHAEEGVELRCGVWITSMTESDDKVSIMLADGNNIEADTAVVGIGALPNTSLAEAAGIDVDNGIAVDETLRTSIPNIFAAGDCCSFPIAVYGGRRVRLEAWRNAQDQGNLAARNMLGGNEAVDSVPYFWSDQYDLTLQVSGLSDGAVSTVRRDLGDDSFILFYLDAEGTLISASGIGRGSIVAKDIRLAEKMIGSRVKVNAEALASPDVRLRSFLST